MGHIENGSVGKSHRVIFLFGANEEDAISDFYGILSVENKMT